MWPLERSISIQFLLSICVGTRVPARRRRRKVFRSDFRRLARNAVVAGLAAGRTIIKPVLAEADVNLTLAQAAILFALALLLGQLALHAAVFGFGGSGGHEQNVDLRLACAKCRRYLMSDLGQGRLDGAVS